MAKKYIGVDVGGTSIKLGIVDDRGEVLIKKESIYSDEGDGRTAIQAIKDSIRELIEEQDLSGSDISGIGVSAAGCINSVEGCVAKNGGNVPG
jgi:glucokinase